MKVILSTRVIFSSTHEWPDELLQWSVVRRPYVSLLTIYCLHSSNHTSEVIVIKLCRIVLAIRSQMSWNIDLIETICLELSALE